MNRRARKEELDAAGAMLLRRALAGLRASQRGPALPPPPSAEDRARFDRSTPAERARAGVLLQGAGFTRADVARGEALLRVEQLADDPPVNDPDPVDDLTRRRARVLLRGPR